MFGSFDAASWQTLATVASAGLALVALLGGLVGAAIRGRERALRREDVHDWSKAAIETLQTLVLLSALPADRIGAAEAEARLTEVIFQTSILTEQGRMFFRNTRSGRVGEDKPPAYRGRRPAVLDCLIAAHQAACHLSDADAETRARLSLVAEDSLKGFVSLIQHEVGRSRIRSPAAGRPGDSIRLDRLTARLDPGRVAARLAGD